MPSTPINGTTGNDSLLGTAGNDSIVGLAGDDRIYGSGGSDTIDGDTGSDSVDYSNELDGVNASLTSGIATRYAGTDSLFNIEHLYGGKGNDELTGDGGNNFLAGGQGADDISGGGGNDTVAGGSGNDSLRGQDGDDTVSGGSGDDYVGGGGGNDRLEGGPGNDHLNGSVGNDTMIGGDGDDFYEVDAAGDEVIESNPDSVFGGGGIDEVIVWGISSYSLPDNIENGSINTENSTLTGNALDNLFIATNKTVTLRGQGGSDWVSYIYSSKAVTVGLNVAGEQTTGYGLYTLENIENLSGSDFGDSLSGDDSPNSLEGRDGSDSLLGLGGDDILIENGQSGSDDYIDGGSGDDTLVYDIESGTAGVTVNLKLSTPQNTGAGSDTILNVEHLYGGKGNDNFTGNSGANKLTGNSGNDTLRGDSGNDTLLGGSGNDLLAGGGGDNLLEGGAGNDELYGGGGNNTFIGGDGDDYYGVSSSGDLVIESNADSISGGVDEVSVEYVASYTLPDNVENAEAGTGVDLLIGNSLNNLFTANSGTITLDGGAGSDRVSYLNSVYFGQGVSIDLNIAGPQSTPRSTQTLVSIENLSGSNYNDSLTGDDKDNSLEGLDGSDLLNGMNGNDRLTGGAGSDRFVFSSSPNGLSNLDTITDFTTLVDKIVLTDAIFTSLTTSGVLPSSNLHAGPGAVAAVDTDDFLIFNTTTGALYYDEDASNNNASPIQIAVLQGVASLDASDIEVGSDNRNVTLTSGSDSLIAGSGNDTVSALQGDDTVYGGDGDDSLSGDGGYDLLFGENGNDTLVGGSRGDVLEGGDGNDSLVGDTDSDWLYGDAGIDTMVGGEGDDIYFVDDAADVVEETEADLNAGGYDVIRSTAPTYTLPANVEAAVIDTDGTAGIIGNELDNNIEANTGDNYIDGMGGFNTVSYHEASGPVTVDLSITVPQDTGGAGTDTLLNIDAISGSDYNDVLTGNSNDNWLDGHYGDDTLTGGDGDDGFVVHSDYTLIIEENADSDTGGHDTVYSNIGSYTLPENVENGYIWNLFDADLTGNSLDNRLHAGEGDNIIDGGEGNDWVSYDQVNAGYYYGDEYYYYSGYGVRVDLANPESQYTYESGWDTLISIENVIGSYGDDDLSGNDDDNELVGLRGSDRLFGNEGNDTLVGGEESDFLDGGAGDDYLDGGDHTDTASYENSLGAVAVNLALNSPQNTGTSGTDTLVNIENIIGSTFADQLTGNSAANELTGGEGDDSLSGGGGNDILDGGLGSDRFLFNSVLDWDLNVDYVYNFELNADKIELDRTVFAALTVTGTLSADNFISGPGVTAAASNKHFIIFDTNDRSLYYDADGNGLNAEPVLFAILSGEGGFLLAASDFEVVNPTILNGTSEDDVLVTGDGNQLINGLEGQDSLDGGAGDDTMTGGDGSDLYQVRESGDDVIETNSDPQIGGYDNVNSYLASYTLPANVENGFIKLQTAASLTGNSLPNYLGAGKGDNTIDGGDSHDFVSYHDATTEGDGVTVSLAVSGSQATGGSGTDTLISIEGLGGTQYNDSLTGNSGNNSLDGNAGDDTISAGAGDDHISEYIGDDLIDGGDGADSLSYYSDADGITVDLNVTGPQNTGGAGTDTIINIEHLFGGKGNDHFTGTAGQNNLYGYGGDDTLTGGAGNDMIEGGDGIDTASYADAPAGVTVNLAITNYQNTEAAGTDQLRGIEILQGSNFADKLSGDNNDNQLFGGDGDDTLNGGLGDDILQGGIGADVFVFNTLPDSGRNSDGLSDFTTGTDKIVLDGTIFTSLPLGPVNSGNFRVGNTALDADDFLLFEVNDGNMLYYDADGSGPISKIRIATMSGSHFVAATDIEVSAGNTLTGTANNDSLIGTSGNDVINGLQGNDYIDGGAGIDTMNGGDGNDNYEVRDVGDLVTETNSNAATGGYDGVNSHLASYILPTNVENGFIRLETAASITGNSLNNYLGAGKGDNTLDGGSGNDYASFFGATTGTTGVTVSLAVSGPQATGGSGTDTLISIENLAGTAYNDILTGNSSNNILDGNAGNDTLSGGDGDDHISESTGDDLIDGGAGSDSLSYYSDADGITVNLNSTGPQNTNGSGTDTIINIEHLFGGKGDDNFIGSAADNNLYGNDGDDTLTGGGGNDMLDGGSGMDTASYANALEGVTVNLGLTTYQYTGGAGTDKLLSIEILVGSSFTDKFAGDLNNNQLIGGDGDDTLAGGFGEDTLEGGAGEDTFVFNTVPEEEYNMDIIRDFTPGSDKILLDSAIFSSLPLGPVNAENFVVGTTALDPNDYLRVNSNGDLYYDADGSGPGSALRIAHLLDSPALTAADIEVIVAAPINGTAGNDSLIGTDGYDVINGLEGHDYIDGGAGIDTMTGGDGNDNYDVREVGDLVVEVTSDSFVGGFDYVNSYLASYTLPANVENGRIVLDTAANLTGNSLNNFIRAGKGDNVIDGSDGVDAVDYYNSVTGSTGVTINLSLTVAQSTGGSGSDTLINIENVFGTNFADALSGNAGSNQLNGYDGNDTLIGGDGDDFLYETTGDDSISGGAGSDTLSYFGTTAALTIDLSINTAQNTGAGSDTIVDVENLSGGNANDVLLGNAQNNSLGGNAGNDTLDGAAGHDLLDGGTGADSMVGGDGNDNYFVDDIADIVVEGDSSTSGFDSVNTSLATYTLGANIENGFIMHTGAASLTGNSLDNLLGAGKGDNVIDGGAGDDTVSYLNAVSNATGVSVSLAVSGPMATGGSGTDTLLNIENLQGSSYNDLLTGNSFSNRLEGFAGNDTLFGGDGDDILVDIAGDNFLDGGNGSDGLSFTSVTTALTINLETTTPQATGVGTSTILNIEHLHGGAGNDTFTGNTGNNFLRGNAGNDTLFGGDGFDLLDGGANADSMVGGNGNDTYIVDSSDDAVVETDSDSNTGGFDFVNSLIASYILPANVEGGAILSTGAADMTGNGLNNTIYASRGNNSIDGGEGSDTVNYVNATTGGTGVTVSLAITTAQTTGGSGDDTLVSVEHLIGSHENDVLTGNALSNRLDGSHGNDSVNGGDGDDTLVGGNGNDTLIGGAGVDRFQFSSALDAASNVDRISDFLPGTDKIVLSSQIFAAFSASGALTSANFRSGSGATTAQDADDFLIHNWINNIIYYDADGSGSAHSPIPFARLPDSDYSTITINDFELLSSAGVVVGSTGGDSLVGGSGPDLLDGGNGDDEINGGEGDDILVGGTGNDVVIGGPGIDTASYSSATSNAVAELRRGKASDGQGGNDTLASIENLQGGPQNDILVGDDFANFFRGEGGDDILYGNGGNDSLLGGDGADLLRGGAGSNFIDGGPGVDTVDYSAATDNIDVSLADGFADLITGADILVNIENVIGGNNIDYLEGNALSNRLEGGAGDDDLFGLAGDDILIGGSGNDVLFGGQGLDVLVGGRGSDAFVFSTTPNSSNLDQILDFDSAVDSLVFDTAAFIGTGWGAGKIDSEYFTAAPDISSAVASSSFLLGYNTTSGVLYFDADGGGTLYAPEPVVTLIGAPTLTAGPAGNFSSYNSGTA